MRNGIVFVGVAMLGIGLVVFLAAAVGANQAAADLVNCLNGSPTYPMFGAPTACTNAMSAFWTYEALEAVGGVLGVLGIVLLVVGLVFQPERPAPVPYYPPPVYMPPPGFIPPQRPQAPPPQP